MSLNDYFWIHAQMPTPHQKRSQTVSIAEKGTWRVCIWMENGLWRKK